MESSRQALNLKSGLFILISLFLLLISIIRTYSNDSKNMEVLVMTSMHIHNFKIKNPSKIEKMLIVDSGNVVDTLRSQNGKFSFSLKLDKIYKVRHLADSCSEKILIFDMRIPKSLRRNRKKLNVLESKVIIYEINMFGGQMGSSNVIGKYIYYKETNEFGDEENGPETNW